MTEQPQRPPEQFEPADQRMAEMLDRSTGSVEMRRTLQGDDSAESADLMARVNALDFVQSVVGENVDLPTRLGDYQILGVLGRGGMGVVYLAWQEDLEREVALKVLSQAYTADPTMRQRFRVEARATAALHHRHIVPIYGYGEAQGQLYFAMERVDGLSLDKQIAAARRAGKKPLEPLDAARRFAGVADALGLAHRRRLLHRDVKPGNILVAADGTLALTDFGLAKTLDHASASLTRNSGGFLGTLHYSSPEQAAGRELSPASDLYSLGVTIFEAVTGELPHESKSTEAVLQSILHGRPRRLRELIHKPPRDLEAVVDKLLSREPQDRYQDGEELAKDLVRIADGDPVHIRRQPVVLRIYRRVRKNPVLSATIAAAAVLLLTTFFLINTVRKEKSVNLQARHQATLAAIVRAVGADAGDVCGPEPLFRTLTGVPAPSAASPSAAIAMLLERATKEQPDDPQVGAIRAALTSDPLEAASELLRRGRGNQALGLLREAIAEQLRKSEEYSAQMRLYRLYLASAVANLTASVGRLGDARTDLARATFLRPGAVFPLVLDVVLQIGDAEDIEVALRVVEREHEKAAPMRRAAIGRLLVALAGLQQPAGANILDLPLSFADRRAVHQLGARWSAEVAGADLATAPQTESLDTRLATMAAALLQTSGTGARLKDAVAALVGEVRQAVHPQSLLQRWQGMVQLLEQPKSTSALLDSEGRPLSAQQQLASWAAFLQSGPSSRAVQDRLDRFDMLQSRYPSLLGMTQLAARLHTEARSARAGALANAWVQDVPEDPDALDCRMKTWLAIPSARADIGDALARALDDAMTCVQLAADRKAILARVVKAWEMAAVDAIRTEHRAAMLATAATFQGLQ